MVDPFSILGLGIIIILALSLGRIFSMVLRFLYYTVIAALILVFLFGISLDQLMTMLENFLLWVF